ncbi:MAG: hypothetical protein MZU91_05315 [Desulfosudis oleivorans]|nr:hypothetical protein [Desulfosudis oleivorans]
MAAPIPGEVTGLLGGILYGPVPRRRPLHHRLDPRPLRVAFTLARTFGRPFVERFVDMKTMGRFDYLLHHKGAVLACSSPLFSFPAFPRIILCYILGLGHLSTMEFLVIGGQEGFSERAPDTRRRLHQASPVRPVLHPCRRLRCRRAHRHGIQGQT